MLSSVKIPRQVVNFSPTWGLRFTGEETEAPFARSGATPDSRTFEIVNLSGIGSYEEAAENTGDSTVVFSLN